MKHFCEITDRWIYDGYDCREEQELRHCNMECVSRSEALAATRCPLCYHESVDGECACRGLGRCPDCGEPAPYCGCGHF